MTGHHEGPSDARALADAPRPFWVSVRSRWMRS